MTKRDAQAREYAAESYEKTDAKRTNSTMNRDATPSRCSEHGGCTLTDEERAAILTAADLLIGSKPGAILRKLLERLK